MKWTWVLWDVATFLLPAIVFTLGILSAPMVWRLALLPAALASIAVPFLVLRRTAFGIRLDEERLEVRLPFRWRKIGDGPEVWRDARRATIHDSLGDVNVELRWFGEREALQLCLASVSDAANERSIQRDLEAGRIFRAHAFANSLFAALLYATAILTGLVIADTLNLIPGALGLALVGAFAMLGASTRRDRAAVDGGGLSVQRGRQRFAARWQEIDWVSIESFHNGAPTEEICSIQSGEQKVILNRIFDDYPRLREIITTQVSGVNPDRVLDKRPNPWPPRQNPASS